MGRANSTTLPSQASSVFVIDIEQIKVRMNLRIGIDSISRDGPDMPYLYSNSEQLDFSFHIYGARISKLISYVIMWTLYHTFYVATAVDYIQERC